MADVTGASLGSIYERLHNAPQYHPMEADTFADWSMEAGDIVTITRDGKEYQSPVHSTQMTWRKGQQVTISSTGNEKRAAIAKMSAKKYNQGSGNLRNTNYRKWYADDQYNQMNTGLIQTSSSVVLYAASKYNEMETGLKLTASSAILYATSKYDEMTTGLKLTASSAILFATNKYSEMTTGLKLTASSAILFATNKYTEMSTGLRLTASSAVLYASNKYTEMSTGLKLTASSAILYASNKYTEMSTGLKLTASSAILYATNKYTEMSTGLNLTASSAILYASNKYTEMSTGLKLTASSAILFATNKYSEMSTGLLLTASTAILYASNRYDEMSAGLKLTASSAILYATNKYTEMSTGLSLTASTAILYASNKYDEMTTGLKLTSSSAILFASNKYTEMSTGLQLTASSAVLFASNKYTEMSTGLKLTASSAVLYASSKYDEMTSGLKLTASSAVLYVDNKYSEMTSGLELTASSAKLYVDSKYDEMTSGLSLTASSAVLYAQSRTSRAEIIARINANGEGEALINADKIKIGASGGSNITLGSAITIDSQGRLAVQKAAAFANALYVVGEVGDVPTPFDLRNAVIYMHSEDGVLTLRKANGETLTFSKATTALATWDGSNRRVVANAVQDSTTVAQDSFYIGFKFKEYQNSGGLGTHKALELYRQVDASTQQSLPGTQETVRIGLNGRTVEVQNSAGIAFTDSPTLDLSYFLEDLPTITTNGTYSVPSGYIGFDEFTVNVAGYSHSAGVSKTPIYITSMDVPQYYGKLYRKQGSTYVEASSEDCYWYTSDVDMGWRTVYY